MGICYLLSANVETENFWESDRFFIIGIPLMLIISGIAGFIRTGRSFWWGIAVVIFQPIILIFVDKTGSSVIDDLIAFSGIALLCVMAAFVGGSLYIAPKR